MYQKSHIAEISYIKKPNCNSLTPYSMNSLFSEFFRKFGGVFLEVCETISGGIWEVFGGKIKENYPEKFRKKIRKIVFTTIKYYLT